MIPSRQNAFEYKKTVCFMLMQAQGGNKTKCPPALSTCKDTIGFVNCFVSNRRNRSYPIAWPRPRFLRKRPRNEVFSRVTGYPSTLFDILSGKLVHQPSYFVACVAGWIVFFACEKYGGGVERAAAPGFFWNCAKIVKNCHENIYSTIL